MLRLLLDRGCPVDVRDRKGATALASVAIQATQLPAEDVQAVMRLLVIRGAGIEAGDHQGYRPLAHAANWAEDAVAGLKFLLDAGARIDAANQDGTTPLMIAVDEVNRPSAAWRLPQCVPKCVVLTWLRALPLPAGLRGGGCAAAGARRQPGAAGWRRRHGAALCDDSHR